MTFIIEVDNAKTLLDIFTVINVLADEATLQLSPDGITVRLMDPSRVAMINSETPKTAFTNYRCDTPTKLAVNLIELTKLLKLGGKDKTALTQTDDGKLLLQFNGAFERNFTIPTLEPNIEDVPAPKINFATKASLATGNLNQTIENSGVCGDHFTITSTPEKLNFYTKGDLMQADITLTKENDALLSLDVKEPSKATYSLSYLSAIVKAGSALSDIINLEYSSDQPIKLDFLLQEGKVEFYLAPRIDSE